MNRLQIALLAATWLTLSPERLPAQEAFETLAPPKPAGPAEGAAKVQPLGLADLIQISMARNPALQQAGLEIEAAQGRAVQAGLYPNPTVSVIGEEMGDPNGPGGFITAPLVSQEIVTAGKLRLGRAAAMRAVDQAGLARVRQRFTLLTTVRQGYFEVLAAQRRVQILDNLGKLAVQSLDASRKLMEAKQIAELDLLQFQVERDRLSVDLEAARREMAAAWQRLAANLGEPGLPFTGLEGDLEAAFPRYDSDQIRTLMLAEHPDILSARVGINRAELEWRRQKVQCVPNVTVAAGYMRDNVTRADEWTFQVGMPVPLFDRNQGNVQTAFAQLGQASQEVSRVENALLARLATAYGDYAAARQRAERYRTAIRPVAQRAFKLAQDAFQGGQFEYLRVLQAQRTLAEADLEYNRALAETWKAASQIAGLILEEHWPECVSPPSQ